MKLFQHRGGIMMKMIFDEIEMYTEKAILFKFDKKKVWLPKSQVKNLDMHGHFFEIPQWLMEAKEIEFYCMED